MASSTSFGRIAFICDDARIDVEESFGTARCGKTVTVRASAYCRVVPNLLWFFVGSIEPGLCHN